MSGTLDNLNICVILVFGDFLTKEGYTSAFYRTRVYVYIPAAVSDTAVSY